MHDKYVYNISRTHPLLEPGNNITEQSARSNFRAHGFKLAHGAIHATHANDIKLKDKNIHRTTKIIPHQPLKKDTM